MRFAALLTLLFLAACGAPPSLTDAGDDDAGATGDAGSSDDAGGPGDDAGSPDAGPVDAGRPDAGSPDAGADAGQPDGGGLSLVTVAAPRELRGVWIATVSNLDWPTAQGQSADAGRASLTALVDTMADAGVNALFFQVRPESDALYASTLEPWSRYLTGTQGQNPGWDPLEALLDLAHARGLEVHAWMNPYRALVSAGSQTATNHVTRTLSGAAITYDGKVVLNPGVPEVRQHVEAVVEDLLGRYDVDGLHFDDYFYPYPAATPFPDDATYAGYQADGGTLVKADWRRENVNALVRGVMGLIVSGHPQVRFGISPFGIWKSGVPTGISGLSSYSDISCDSVTWMNQGWVDYLAPQLYWPIGGPQDFIKLSTWWAQGTMGGRHLFPGLATYRLNTSSAWTLAEYRAQLAHRRTLTADDALGEIHFRASDLRNNRHGYTVAGVQDVGVTVMLKSEFYAKPALPPVLPRAGASVAPAVPFVMLNGTTLSVTTPQPQATRFFALYREVMPGQWELTAVRGGARVDFAVSSGAWAVSAIARGGAESQGVRISVP
ncbi:MAG: glycoside hydrolase family 10 protein [Myxococcota bacterium]